MKPSRVIKSSHHDTIAGITIRTHSGGKPHTEINKQIRSQGSFLAARVQTRNSWSPDREANPRCFNLKSAYHASNRAQLPCPNRINNSDGRQLPQGGWVGGKIKTLLQLRILLETNRVVQSTFDDSRLRPMQCNRIPTYEAQLLHG
jgi:hypothetical protein